MPGCNHNSTAVPAGRHARQPAAALCAALLAAVLLAGIGQAASAQQPPVHYPHSVNMPPGFVGGQQLQRGGPLPGYFQPVRVALPPRVEASLLLDGHFQNPQSESVTAGMLIGKVYRLRITNIPNHEGAEVYPTIELVNRLYPPEGQALRFPIPIELTMEELQYALGGRFVTRVIYLEDPAAALPMVQDKEQRVFEVGSGQDPLKVADRMGRPMAILRMGSRTPKVDGATGRFLFGSPPLLLFPQVEADDDDQPRRDTASAIQRYEPVPRTPIRR